MNWPEDFVDKIVYGNCLDVMERIPDRSVDLIVTDPPYGVSYKKKGEEYMIGDTINLFPYFMPHFRRLLKPEGALYLFTSTTRLVEILPLFQTYFKLHLIIVWDKKVGRIPHHKSHYKLRWEPILYGSTGLHRVREYKDDVVCVPIVRGKSRVHTTQKPVELMNLFIEQSSSEGEIVLDPFIGAGTTAIACKGLNRKFVGIEINPEYCETAKKRLASIASNFLELMEHP